MSDVKITILKNGPYIVSGAVELLGADGKPIKPEDAGGKLALCRCGLSEEKPFCDGSHRRKEWADDVAS